MSIYKNPEKNEAEKIRVVFMGTPEFAVPGLTSLITSNDFKVVAIYTQADKPIGRKQELNEPPVKKLAKNFNIPVFQPLKIKTEIENIKSLAPDLIVVIAYGKIIPQEILDIPKYACINVHASLLPKYRGAACLNAPILNGDPETGITIMKMDAGLDTGPILKQGKIELTGRETLANVHDRLAVLGAELLIPSLKLWLQGDIIAQEQNESLSSYVSIVKKEDGKLDFSKTALELERQIRAYNPWPGTYFLLNKQVIKIIEAEITETPNDNNKKVGEIYQENKQLYVKCGQNSLNILRLQLSGKRISTAKEFLNGHTDIIGKVSE